MMPKGKELNTFLFSAFEGKAKYSDLPLCVEFASTNKQIFPVDLRDSASS